jgi:hypothetical protein
MSGVQWLSAGAVLCFASATVRGGPAGGGEAGAAKEIRLTLENALAFERRGEPITAGVPLAKGFARRAEDLTVLDPDGKAVPSQVLVTGTYRDGSPRWVLLDFAADVPANAKAVYRLVSGALAQSAVSSKPDPSLALSTHKRLMGATLVDGVAAIDTGAATFRIDTRRFRLFDSVKVGGVELIRPGDERAGAVLVDEKGAVLTGDQTPAQAAFEDAGPMRVVLCVRGRLGPAGPKLPLAEKMGSDPNEKTPRGQTPVSPPADYVCRLHFFAGRAEVRVFFTLHNPAAQNHPGNIWDYGSGGSLFIEDFSLLLPLAPQDGLAARVTAQGTVPISGAFSGNGDCRPLLASKLYQDSSGGANWQSVNHIDKDYNVPVTFRGYRIYDGEKQVGSGDRADGWIDVSGKSGGVAVAIREFWQNFPKALEFADGRLRIALWPREYAGVHELLGGEQKTHEMLFVFHPAASPAEKMGSAPNETTSGGQTPFSPPADVVARRMQAFHRPMYAMPDIDSVLASNAFWVTAPLDRRKFAALEETCDAAVRPGPAGPDTIQTKWEIIDEFDWRHFGDTFADNEAAPAQMVKDFPAHHPGGRPISHYVNEYDVIYTLMVQGLRRGDAAWMWMADVMSRHHADICIYHTDVGAPAYAHGPFMHTTHETAAYRSGMRAYPIEAKRYNLQYGQGGGPNAGHTYVVGLAQHYWLTGDRVSREAFLEVANWVADGPWFVKSMMGDQRGYGNFLITLVYAFQLTGDRKYYDRAMTLTGWVDKPFEGLGGNLFAKALARFLQMKLDNGEADADFRAARDLLAKFGDLYLTLPASRWDRYLEQRTMHAEVLCLAALYTAQENPNREKYRDLGATILDEALDRFPRRFAGTKTWVMCFANTGAYLRCRA